MLAVALLMVGMAYAPARADTGASLLFLVQIDDIPGKGHALFSNRSGTEFVVAQGLSVVPLLGCDGGACLPARPARIETLRAGQWVTWSRGSLATLAASTKSLSSQRTTTIRLRPVLPAHDGLAAVVGPLTTFDFRPKTGVRLSGSIYVRPTLANGFADTFRAGRGNITVQVTPAVAGRRILLEDAGVDGTRLIAKITTDRRGRATFGGDFRSVSILSVTVKPTPGRAGWQIRLLPAA